MPKAKSNRNTSSQQNSPSKIFILSGGTGRTGQQLLRAALAQFPDNDVEVIERVGVRSADKAAKSIAEAASAGAIVCHSFVEPSIRRAIESETSRLGVACIDALGPAISILGDHLKTIPRGRAGLLYQVHREQFDRTDAMDFTLAHDDGQRLSTLKNADVILVGASRTSKSVTCCYLAFRGIRAGNVPLIPGVPIPKELSKLNKKRVIGLTMSAAHLESIRQSRVERMGVGTVDKYASLRDIQSELRAIREVMSAHDWQCVDVSYKATEEVAEQIVEMLPRRRVKG